MQTLKDKLLKFSAGLARKYRLAGQPLFADIELTFRLLGHLVSSNGRVSDFHLQQIIEETEILHLSDEQIPQATQAYLLGQELIADDFELSLRHFKQDELAKELLLQSCWRLIWADRHLGVREYQLVHLWGYWLGWSRPAIEKLGVPYRPVYVPAEHRAALQLLGVAIDSSPEHIRQMYKRQLSYSHPDKVMGTGGTVEQICEATEMTVKIHEAYTLLRMLHGF